MSQITIDFAKTLGKIKPMHSTNNGPAGEEVRGTSNKEYFQAAGIPYVRNHDASFYMDYGGEYTVDVHRIFRNFDADENLPESYDFLMTDLYMKSVYSVGSKMFYRLGTRIEHEPRKCGTIPPKDFAKWARICEHIIRHYTEGWADGFHYDVEYWEIWNEPECRNSDGSNPCWQGTDEQFCELYAVTAKHLKSCFPHLKIGGPAVTGIWLNEGCFLYKFFPYVHEHNVPMDFFSFHRYAEDPHKLVKATNDAKALCEQYGYGNAELILNEWNYIRGWLDDEWKYSLAMEKGLKGASYVASAMCLCQQSPLDHLMYYDASPCGRNGMLDTDTRLPLKGYYTFPMFNTLYTLGTEVESISDDETVAVAAACGENDNTIGAVMLSYYEDLDEGDVDGKLLRLCFRNVPVSENGTEVVLNLLDAEHNNEEIRSEIFTSGNFDLMVPVNLFTTCLLTLRRVEKA